MSIGYLNSEEALTVIKKIMSQEDLKTQHLVLLKLPDQYCNYHNPTRLYNENEVCWIEKTTLATMGIIDSNPLYNKERVKFISQSKMTVAVGLDDRTQWRSYQYMDGVCYWLKDERLLTGCKRRSISDGKLYEALVDIPRADVDPALVTDKTKYVLVEEEIALTNKQYSLFDNLVLEG